MIFLRITGFVAVAAVLVYFASDYFSYDVEGELEILNETYLQGDYQEASKRAKKLHQAIPYPE